MKIKNILLIENSEIDILVITETLLLKNNQFKFKIIRNGSDTEGYSPIGLVQGHQEKPDLVIVNEELIDIEEINTLLKTLNYYVDAIPIVLFTSSKFRVLSDLEERVNEVVVKPLEINAFINAIHNISRTWLNTVSA